MLGSSPHAPGPSNLTRNGTVYASSTRTVVPEAVPFSPDQSSSSRPMMLTGLAGLISDEVLTGVRL